jgi:hypothetical protein
MYRKREAKEDFFYACVVFAMLAVIVLSVAVEFFAHYPEAYSVYFDEGVEPREVAAEADAHADVAMRAA